MQLSPFPTISRACAWIDGAARLALLAAGLAMLAPVALAADVRYTLPSLAPRFDLVPVHLAQPDAGGFWASGYIDGPPQASGNTGPYFTNLLLHFDNANQPTVVRYSDAYLAAVVRAADGGVFAANSFCDISRYAADGTLRWRQTGLLSSTGSSSLSNHCLQWSADGEGGLWVQGVSGIHKRIVRLGPNGTLTAQMELGDRGLDAIGELQADPLSSNVYIGGKLGADAASHAVLLSLDRLGVERWHWQSPDAGTQVNFLKLAPNGRLEGAGVVASGAQVKPLVFSGPRDSATVSVQRYEVTLSNLLGLAVSGDGSGYFLGVVGTDEATRQLTLYRLGDDATLGGNVNVAACKGSLPQGCGSLRSAATGDALVLSRPFPQDPASAQTLLRYQANGNLTSQLPLATPLPYAMSEWQALPQGDVIAADATFSRFNATQKVAGPATAHFAPYDNRGLHTLLEDDGSSFVLSQDSNAQQYTLMHSDSQGQLLWRRDAPGSWIDGIGPFDSPARNLPLFADAQKICIGGFFDDTSTGQAVVECWHRNDGTLAFHVVLNDHPANLQLHVQRLADGGILAIYHGSDGNDVRTRLSPAGTVTASTPLPRNGYGLGGIYSNAAGASVAFRDLYSPAATAFVGIAPDGTYAFELPLTHPGQVAATAILDDGSSVFVTTDSGPYSQMFSATRVDAGGHVLWQKPILTIQAAYYALTATLHITAGSAYFAIRPYGSSGEASLQRLSLQTGEIAWTRTFAQAGDYTSTRLLPTREGNVLAIYPQSGLVQTRLFDGATGNSLGVNIEGCGDHCVSGESVLDSSDRLYLLTANFDALHATQLQISRLDHATVPTPSITLDQGALGGAWWAPYTRGQGFMLDVLPATHTFFMPWFTYTSSGSNDPAELRWYTIQGNIPTAASTLELGIYDSTGGAFDAAAPTTAHRVGTATLAFADCDRGSLHYRFDAPNNDGKEGDIALARLLTRTGSCKLADGSIAPPPSTPTPQGGFDARMNGSWYEPATAGQGLQLVVQPGGILFAPWFTYDPAGTANDPTSQHWMTLQGSLADAKNGVATVAIAQALGGTFDAQPTDNQYAVGNATLTVLACDKLRVDYLFDDKEIAGAFRKKNGSLDLIKIGGCAAP